MGFFFFFFLSLLEKRVKQDRPVLLLCFKQYGSERQQGAASWTCRGQGPRRQESRTLKAANATRALPRDPPFGPVPLQTGSDRRLGAGWRPGLSPIPGPATPPASDLSSEENSCVPPHVLKLLVHEYSLILCAGSGDWGGLAAGGSIAFPWQRTNSPQGAGQMPGFA